MGASNVMPRDALMDGHGQECTFPEAGRTYIAYFHDDERPEYTVWRRRDDGLFAYLHRADTVGEATAIMARDARGEE